jgi:hypothetical protein
MKILKSQCPNFHNILEFSLPVPQFYNILELSSVMKEFQFLRPQKNEKKKCSKASAPVSLYIRVEFSND